MVTHWQWQEAYCSALSKLKEGMEEPQQQTIAFFNAMHSQLRELARTNPQSADVFLVCSISYDHTISITANSSIYDFCPFHKMEIPI